MIPCEFDDGGTYSDGLSAVSKNGKYGAIDKDGKTVISFEWDYIGKISEGMMSVKKDGKYGFVNTDVVGEQYCAALFSLFTQ